jgi:hypothetical protein
MSNSIQNRWRSGESSLSTDTECQRIQLPAGGRGAPESAIARRRPELGRALRRRHNNRRDPRSGYGRSPCGQPTLSRSSSSDALKSAGVKRYADGESTRLQSRSRASPKATAGSLTTSMSQRCAHFAACSGCTDNRPRRASTVSIAETDNSSGKCGSGRPLESAQPRHSGGGGGCQAMHHLREPASTCSADDRPSLEHRARTFHPAPAPVAPAPRRGRSDSAIWRSARPPTAPLGCPGAVPSFYAPTSSAASAAWTGAAWALWRSCTPLTQGLRRRDRGRPLRY